MRNDSLMLAKPSAFNTSLVNNSLLSVAQQVLTDLGWEDLRPAIYAAEQTDRMIAEELQTAHAAFMEEPDAPQQRRLQAALDKTIQKLQVDYQKIIKLKTQAEQHLSQSRKASPMSSYTSRLRGWAFNGLQQFFDSDDASVVMRYNEIAQNRQASIEALKRYRNALTMIALENELESKTENNSLQTLSIPELIVDIQDLETTPGSSAEIGALSPAKSSTISSAMVPSHARRLLAVDIEEWDSREFQVNTYTKSWQENPSVGTFSDGGFVIVWQSDKQDSDHNGVYAQRYSPSSVMLGSEFQVNTYTENWQENPSVGTFSDGGFVIAWQSWQDDDRYGVYAQRYSSSGSMLGREFYVNTYTEFSQENPSIGTFSDGSFVIAWQSDKQDGDSNGVYAQCFSPSGTVSGREREFLVNTYTKFSQENPSVGTFSDGGFVIAWQSDKQDGDDWGVYAQHYSPSGAVLGREFPVNTYKKGWQGNPSVGTFSDGGFVIAWQSYGQDGDDWGVYAQRYSPSGVMLGREFPVNRYTTGWQGNPSVGTFSDGSFVIAWDGCGQDGDDWGVYAQLFSTAKPSSTPSPTRLTAIIAFLYTPRVIVGVMGGLGLAVFLRYMSLRMWRRQASRVIMPVEKKASSPIPVEKKADLLESHNDAKEDKQSPVIIQLSPLPSSYSRDEKKKEVALQALSHSNNIIAYSSLISVPKEKTDLLPLPCNEKSPVIAKSPVPPTFPYQMEKKKEYVVPVSFEIDPADLEIFHDVQLGKGAYGTVHPGTYNGEQVAIKKLNLQYLNPDQKTLKREAETMVSHSTKSDHLVILRGVCIKNHYFYLVMELMKGGSLYGLLREKPKLPLVVIYSIALGVSHGLQILHENKILHRDLKSVNVLLKYVYKEGDLNSSLAKIGDFGFAKVKSEEVSARETKGPKGTPGWMAPELFNDQPPEADYSIDIYAFGMILWELVPKPEYRIPFQGVKPEDFKKEKIERGLEQKTIPQDCEPAFAKLIRRCWQPSERPTAKELSGGLYRLFQAAESKENKGSSKAPAKKDDEPGNHTPHYASMS